MDRCDVDAEYRINPRHISFYFWVEGARYTGSISGDALDKLAGGDAGFEAGCLAAYRQNWQQIHGIAALKLAAGMPSKILLLDV